MVFDGLVVGEVQDRVEGFESKGLCLADLDGYGARPELVHGPVGGEAEPAHVDEVPVQVDGGLGEVDEADVHKQPVPSMNLIEAMRLAMDRDCVARQYVNGFQQVFCTAERVAANTKSGLPLGESIVHAFMQLLSEMPDSLIARKCGLSKARSVTVRAAKIMDQWDPRSTDYRDAVGEFDFYLRSDGHRLNPGTTADIMAAALFVLLREQRIDWPVKFYG